MLKLSLFGTPQLMLDGQLVDTLRSIKGQALLYYLVMHDRPQVRITLAGLLWPEKDEGTARTNLRQAVRQLNVIFPDYLVTTREQVALNRDLPLEVDTLRFRDYFARGLQGDIPALEWAIELYTGEFLASFFLEDAAEYESWILMQREQFRSQALEAMKLLADRYAQQMDITAAQKITRRLLAIEPWHEASYRQMMRLLVWDGQPSAAVAQYETCRQILLSELGVEPSPETTALYKEILAGQLDFRIEKKEALSSPVATAIRHNLPRQYTPFIGREVEIEQLTQLLTEPACALLTVRGPGGIGKTRLAVETSLQILNQFPDGVWFVDLAPVSHVEQFFAAVGAGLSLELASRKEVKSQVLDYLKNKQLLIILDNFEHLITAAERLLTLLDQAPGIKILATSREALNLRAEWIFELEGLEFGKVSGSWPMKLPAVQLFIQSLRQRQPGFEVTADNEHFIGRICELVQGMPLAIELAAAQARSIPLAEMMANIEQNLDVLATEMKDVPERQRSIRSVFRYSWQLLLPNQKSVLARLAAFRGSFTTVAASMITGATEAMLQELFAKSFLHQPLAGRYQVHDVLRRYANEELELLGETLETEIRHSNYYLNFLAEREVTLTSLESRLAVSEVQQELNNIYQAWLVAGDRNNYSLLEQSHLALYYYLNRCGLLQEGEWLFSNVIHSIQQNTSGDDSLNRDRGQILSKLLAEYAQFLLMRAHYVQATVNAQSAITHAQAFGDQYSAILGALVLGSTLSRQGAYEDSLVQLKQALNLTRQAKYPRLQAAVLSSIGVVHIHLGDFERALAYLEQALSVGQSNEDWGRQAAIANNLAIVNIRTGNYERAKKLYEESRQIYESMGDFGGKSLVLANLGIIALHRGEYWQAERLCVDALALCRQSGERWLESAVLNTMGVARLRMGDSETAAEILSEAQTLCREIGNRYSECEVLSNLCKLSNQIGDFVKAADYGRLSVELASEMGEQTLHSIACLALGRSYEGQGCYTEAREAYEEVLRHWQDAGRCGLVAEAKAGQARILLAYDNLGPAKQFVDGILACMDSGSDLDSHVFDGTEEPLHIYYTCYQILQGLGDNRAGQLLVDAYNLLQERAALIANGALRQSFRNNIDIHQAIIADYLTMNTKQKNLSAQSQPHQG